MDGELLANALRRRDPAALRDAVREHHGPLLRFLQSVCGDSSLVEEFAQEAWVRALAALPEFEGRSSFRTWLFRIGLNHARTRLVRASRELSFEELEPGSAVPEERFDERGHWSDPPRRLAFDDPETALLRGEILRGVEAALATLPPAQRAALILRDVEGLDGRDACHVLGVSESNLRVLLHRARTRVRAALERAR